MSDLSHETTTVVSRELIGRRRQRLKLTLADGTLLELAPSVLEQHPLREGDPVDAALRARLIDTDLRIRCRDAALSLLGVRARSRRELADRLRRKEFPASITHAVLDTLESEGWLDDLSFARGLVHDRVRFKPRAPVRLQQELQRKGGSREIAHRAVDDVFEAEAITPAALAREAAVGWVRRQSRATLELLAANPWSEEREKVKRRLIAHLARRGFRGSLAVDAIDAARQAARNFLSD